jgi:hypothetical protein
VLGRSAARFAWKLINIYNLQMMVGTVKASGALALAAVIVISVLKESTTQHSGALFVLNRGFHIFQLVLGSVLFVLINTFVAIHIRRLAVACRMGRRWSKRRLFALQTAIARAIVMESLIATYLVSNAIILKDPGQFCRASWPLELAITWGGVGWNTILLCAAVEAHGTVPHKVRCLSLLLQFVCIVACMYHCFRHLCCTRPSDTALQLMKQSYSVMPQHTITSLCWNTLQHTARNVM